MEQDWIIDNIRNLLEERRTKVETISKEIGISKGEFSKILNGKREDYFKYLQAIADFFNVGFRELVKPQNLYVNSTNNKLANDIYFELHERLILQYKATLESNSSLIIALKASEENYKRKYYNLKIRVKELEK